MSFIYFLLIVTIPYFRNHVERFFFGFERMVQINSKTIVEKITQRKYNHVEFLIELALALAEKGGIQINTNNQSHKENHFLCYSFDRQHKCEVCKWSKTSYYCYECKKFMNINCFIDSHFQ